MILTSVLIAVVTFTITTFVFLYKFACNYSRTVVTLLNRITNDIGFTLNLGSIFKVIVFFLFAPLAEEFSVALFANYFISLTSFYLSRRQNKIGNLMGTCVYLFWLRLSYIRDNSMGYHRKQSKI